MNGTARPSISAHLELLGMFCTPITPQKATSFFPLTCFSFRAACTEGLFSICWANLLFLALASCCCCCMVARIFTGIGCLFFSMLVKLQGRIKRVFKLSFITYIYWHFTVLKIGSSRSREPLRKERDLGHVITYSSLSTSVQELETQE